MAVRVFLRLPSVSVVTTEASAPDLFGGRVADKRHPAADEYNVKPSSVGSSNQLHCLGWYERKARGAVPKSRSCVELHISNEVSKGNRRNMEVIYFKVQDVALFRRR